jgi:hypothetical protein
MNRTTNTTTLEDREIPSDHTAAAPPPRSVAARDDLIVRPHAQATAQYVQDAYGMTALRLNYGGKEISFEEPALFGFGETLVRQSRFVASSAMQWGNGYDWPRVSGLLDQLLEEGILQYADAISGVPQNTPSDKSIPPCANDAQAK